MKLYNSITVGYYSVKYDKMMSAYMSEFVSFNVLDEDYVKSKELLLDKPEENKDEPEENKDESKEVDIEDILPTVRERLLSKTGNITELSVELADQEGNFGTPNSRVISFKRYGALPTP